MLVRSLVNLLMLCGVGGGSRVVRTGRGAVRGRLAPQPPHYAYLGIPYGRHARSDRFKAPKPARSWDGTFEATYQIKCPQPDGTGTEDCLVVNVFSPETAASQPVIVVVHGGNFQRGWGPFRPPTRLLARNLVVVTFNYRLGSLGFLCLGTTDAPGNAGLKDQVAALYWIHKNIAHFGGNPLDVTLYGIQSGAASIQLIMLSGAATGLFHKVILESGSALSPLALAYDPKLTAFDAAAAMGYAGADSLDELAKFYRDLPVDRIVNASTMFLPCIENNLDSTHSLLEADPLEIYKQRNYQKAPKPARSWDGTFEATYQIKCPQPDGTGTEDCLVVNVFSPETAASQPVIVVVHGGNFQRGWGPFRPPTRLLARNLVVVTFNYRLGSLGFLCLGTTDAPGNAGLKDQVAALYWIHKNIAHFGGNPLDVTLYGIQSGAASIQLIMLSGAATGLFHKVILESGSALSPLALAYDPKLTAFDAAAAMGYAGADSLDELAKFYRDLPVDRIVNASTMFLPCIENNLDSTHSLLEADPLEIYKQRNYQKVPMIIVYTSSVGATLIKSTLVNSNLPESFDDLLPNNLKFDSLNIKHRVAEIVKEFYVGKNDLDAEDGLVQNYIDYFKVVLYEYPIIKAAVLHAATGSLPIYLMKFLNGNSMEKAKENKGFKNMFDYLYDNHTFAEEDQLVAEQLVTLWSNFIMIGDPTPLTTSLIPLVWQPVQAKEGDNALDVQIVQGLVYGKTLQMSQQLADERIIFWDHIYMKFYREHVPFSEEVEIN